MATSAASLIWFLLLSILSLGHGLLTYSPRDSSLGNYSTAAIAVDGVPCAKVGMDVIREGGTAVDAAIAALFCNGIYTPHSMGIGGGFLMTIYQRETGTVSTLISRETAPSYAHEDMFDGDALAAQEGPLAVAIPGEVRGYYEAKRAFGSPDVSWWRLIRPAVDMCNNGVEVSWTLAEALEDKKEEIFADPGLRDTFVNPETNDTWKEGDVYTRKNLGLTLERIGLYGPEEFYSGEVAQNMIDDLTALGGKMTLEDLDSFRPEWRDPISVDIGGGLSVHSVPPPASGVVLAYILNILKHYGLTPGDGEEPVMFHRIAEAFKWAYGSRSKLGDPADPEITDFIDQLVANMTSEIWAYDTYSKINDSYTVNDPDYYGADYYEESDHGTSHTSVLAPNGDAVSVTSTINLFFGAKILSPSTGIIFNDCMDDFSYPNITNDFNLPPSPNNFVKPGKRALSSTCPAVVVDEAGDVRLVVGAAGGTKITTATSLAAVRNLWLGEDIKEAIDGSRIHHQLMPMEVRHEEDQRQDVLDFLASRGHNLTSISYGGVVCGVEVAADGRVYANADRRKDGATDGF